MEARSIPLATSIRPITDRIAVRLANLFAALLIVGLVLAALVLVVRRAAGVLTSPLPPIALLATGIIAATTAAVARWLPWGTKRGVGDRTTTALVRWLPGAAIVALAAAVSLPDSSALGRGFLWIAVVAEEAWTWRRSNQQRSFGRLYGERRSRRAAQQIPPDNRVDPVGLSASPLVEAPLAAHDVVQQLIRTQSAAGIDRMQGWLRTNLEPGERNATLHVAFCPPFDETPKLTVLQVSGPASRIKPVQLLPYGVRLEMKRLLAGHDKATIILEFSAEAPMSSINRQAPEPALPSP